MIVLDRIPIFIAVAEELNFSRAAEKLGRTQSAVSQSVALLEEELGVPLFFRENRRIRLTEPGEILLKQSRRSLSHLETALLQLREWAGLERGRLVLGSSHTAASYLLPPVLEEFHHSYPSIEVIIKEVLSEDFPPALRSGSIDLAIGILPEEAEDFTVIPLMERQDVIVSQKPISEEELPDCSFLLSGPGMQSRLRAERLFSQWASPPKITMECSSIEALKRMVSAGLGVTILPKMAVLDELRKGIFHALPLKNDGRTLYLGLMSMKESAGLPGVKAFAGCLRTHFQ